MSDTIQTVSPDQLGERTAPSDDLFSIVFAPGGPLQKLSFRKMLAKLIAANLAKATKADLDADLAYAADSVALVFADPTANLNGWYRKAGASGAGAWTQFEVLTKAALDAVNTARTAVDAALPRARNSVPFSSWANLTAATGMSAGDRASVLADDTGTHTDPVVGGTVKNAGVYEYSAAPAGWRRVSDLDSQILSATSATLADWQPKTLSYTKGQRVKTDGTLETAAGYAVFGCAIDSTDLAHRITIYTTASGYRTANFYSDPAGAVGSFISSSAQAGPNLWNQLSLIVPSNARYVRFNSTDFNGSGYTPPVYETQKTIATATLVADNRARLLTVTPVALASPATINSNQRVNADGTVATAAGYGNALVVLAADTTALVIDTWVIGTGNPAIVWYSDAAGTTMLLPGSQTGGAPARVQATVSRPAGAVSARVAFSTSQAYSIQRLKRISSVEEVLATFKLTGVSAALTGPVKQTPPGGVLTSTRIDPSTGATSTSAGYTAAFFPITDETQTYRASGNVIGSSRYLATFYSDSGGTAYLGQQWVSGTSSPSGAAFDKAVLTLPAGTRCIGVNGSTANPPQLFLDMIPTGIAEKLGTVDRLASTWAGKNLTTEGDSITANNNWQAALVQRLGMSAAYTNTGVGGTRVAYRSGFTDQAQCMCDDARVNAIPATTDLLIFMGGTNDHGQNIPLGTLTAFNVRSAGSFDPYTFYGALELTALKHKTRLPTKRILWAGQTYTDRSGAVPSGWANGLINTLGLSASDYSDACEAVARKWGLPFLRMISECGWDSTNISSFVGLGDAAGVYIHPIQAGADRMSNVFFARVRQIEPIA